MKKRALTGLIITVIYVGILLLTIYAHPIFFDIFIVLLMLTSGLEMSRALAKKFSKPIEIFVLLNVIIGYLAFVLIHNFIGRGSGGITAYFGVLALVFVAALIFNMFSKTRTMRNIISTMFVLVYPVAILVYFLGLNYLQSNLRLAAILLVVIVSSLTDMSAYFVGSTLKGPKLCPNISPKKTISGACGGLLGGLLGGAIVMLFSFFNLFDVQALVSGTGWNIFNFMMLGLFGSVFTQLGDLVASYVKRSCDIKDYGALLPGHGGVIDRIDGLMLNAVFVYVYMMVISLL